MDQDTLDNLKQLIAAAVSQQLALQTEDIKEEFKNARKEMHEMRAELTQKIDNLSEHVATALDTSNEETESRIKDHEVRITNLEAKAA